MEPEILAEKNHDNGQFDEASVRLEKREDGIWLRENDGCNVSEHKIEDTGIDQPKPGEDLTAWAAHAITQAAQDMIPDDLDDADRIVDLCAWGLPVDEIDLEDTDLPDDTEVCIVGDAKYYGPYTCWGYIEEWPEQEISKGVMSLATARAIMAEISENDSIPELSHNQATSANYTVVAIN